DLIISHLYREINNQFGIMHQALTGYSGAGVFLFSIQFCVKYDAIAFVEIQNASNTGYTPIFPFHPYN
ncbi:MAG: hypothetical protein IKS39_06855, partial [Clostridia bacterium]|nr:hypothetical protein [Clostridia bacterium]